LIENQPYIKQKKIFGFQIKKHPTYKYYQTFIISDNNISINFSFVSCCNFNAKHKKTYSEYSLIQAMRTTIGKQILEFKNDAENVVCNFCETNTAEEYHIDHDTISFKQLSNQFILENPMTPKQFDKNRNYRTIFKNEDKEYKKKWYDYHKKMATLQILCRTCNLKKPRT
jgi:hypothetical protein